MSGASAFSADPHVRKYKPRELIGTVAEGLNARGFEIRQSDSEDSRRLTVVGLENSHCMVTVQDCGFVQWEYWPDVPDRIRPIEVANLITKLLNGGSDTGLSTKSVKTPPDVSFKGVVGQNLRASGFDVGMEVYEDLDALDVLVEIVVTNPASRRFGEIRVTDDGAVLWKREYTDNMASRSGSTAEDIIDVLSHAISALCH